MDTNIAVGRNDFERLTMASENYVHKTKDNCIVDYKITVKSSIITIKLRPHNQMCTYHQSHSTNVSLRGVSQSITLLQSDISAVIE